MPSRAPLFLAGLLLFSTLAWARAPLVLLTDFGTQDGAVSAMKGVAYSVSQDLLISDLSHENSSIFEGAYRLFQTEQVPFLDNRRGFLWHHSFPPGFTILNHVQDISGKDFSD